MGHRDPTTGKYFPSFAHPASTQGPPHISCTGLPVFFTNIRRGCISQSGQQCPEDHPQELILPLEQKQASCMLRHAGCMCSMEADCFTLYRVDPTAAPPHLAPDCPDLRGTSERCSQHSRVCHQSLFGSKLVARNLNLALPNFILWVQAVWCSVDLLLLCVMCSSVWTAICLLTPPLVSASRPQVALWLSSRLGKQTQARWL